MIRRVFAALGLCGLIIIFDACASDTPSPAGEAGEAGDLIEAARETTAQVPDLNSDEVVNSTRWARRLQLDRLQATIPRVAGKGVDGKPITWRVNGKEALSDAVFGKVLGRPDYVRQTAESRVSTSLYLKLMRDMARDVCTQMVVADQAPSDNEKRNLWRFAPIDGSASEAEISQNIQYLLLRFLSLRVDAQHELVSDYREVFDAGVASLGVDPQSVAAQAEGWRGVCIALLESAAFHID